MARRRAGKPLPAALQPLFQQAAAAYQAGRYGDAVVMAEQLCEKNRKDPRLFHLLGLSRIGIGAHEGASEALREAIKVDPSKAAYSADLGQALFYMGRIDEAESMYRHATRLNSRHEGALSGLAQILAMTRRPDEGAEALRPIVESGEASPGTLIAYAACLRSMERRSEAIEVLQQLTSREDLPRSARRTALFDLGRLLDRTGRYDDAFQALQEANQLHGAVFDAKAHRELTERVCGAWSAEAFAELPRVACESARPVFIVGVLRSGTSLLEQMLGCHPDIAPGGELPEIQRYVFEVMADQSIPTSMQMIAAPERLTQQRLDTCSQRYLQTLASIDAESPRITDKMPGNFNHLGLIALLFPEARIIHCTRDPRDVAISCFSQNFSGPNEWTYDLANIGCYIRDAQRLMEHWRALLGEQILDVSYESLVTEPEQELRRVLEHLCLTWDPACLQFHESDRVIATSSIEQVRKPLYSSSIGRHTQYGAHLGPMIEALEGGHSGDQG